MLHNVYQGVSSPFVCGFLIIILKQEKLCLEVCKLMFSLIYVRMTTFNDSRLYTTYIVI